MQRLYPLRLLPLTQLIRARDLEKRGRRLDQPLRLNRTAAMHVLLRRLDQTVVNHVLGGFAEQAGAGVQIHGRALDEGFVAFARVFARGVAEEA